MPYALYKTKQSERGKSYVFKESVPLFGCNAGYIPKLLKARLDPSESEPLAWHINIATAMSAGGQTGEALIINLKPKAPNLSLYEIMDVWGYSSDGWTPIMFYLRGLFVDENPCSPDENAKNFLRTEEQIDDPIFSLMYLTGTVREGTIEGRWTPPGPSSTNAVLLWPDTLRLFYEKADEIISRRG